MAKALKGKLVYATIGGVKIACQTNGTLTIGKDVTTEDQCKDGDGWNEGEVTSKNWSLSVDHKSFLNDIAVNQMDIIELMLNSDDPVEIEFLTIGQVGYPYDMVFSGTAIITNFSMETPANAIATATTDFTGQGAPTFERIPASNLPIPPTPTNFVTNTGNRTMSWTDATGYPFPANAYEYSVNAGSSVVGNVNARPFTLPGSAGYGVGQVGIRVKGTDTNQPSQWLFNTVAFPAILVTPAAPTNPITDNDAHEFDWTDSVDQTFGAGQYEETLDGGDTYTTAVEKPIFVGNANFAIGEVGVRVKGIAGVRNPSATLFNTTAFTESANNGIPVTVFDALNNVVSDGNGNLGLGEAGDTGNAIPTLAMLDSDTGFIMMTYPNFTISGEGATPFLGWGVGINPHYGAGDALAIGYMQVESGGKINYQLGDNSIVFGTAGTINIGGKVRLRLTLSTCFLEYSNDGVTFTEIVNTPRLSGTLRTKLELLGNRKRYVNLRYYKA